MQDQTSKMNFDFGKKKKQEISKQESIRVAIPAAAVYFLRVSSFSRFWGLVLVLVSFSLDMLKGLNEELKMSFEKKKKGKEKDQNKERKDSKFMHS